MVAEVYTELRDQILKGKAENFGLKPAANEVWGVMMDVGTPNGVASFVALADGTVSLYTSNGGGVIGLGPHPGPHRVGKELIILAQQFVAQAKPTTNFPLPQPGITSFYLLRGTDVLVAEGKRSDLGQVHHPLLRLWLKWEELITEIRMVEQKVTGGR
jgi:hypothetical protein